MDKRQAITEARQARQAAKVCRRAGADGMAAKHMGAARHFGHVAKSLDSTARWSAVHA